MIKDQDLNQQQLHQEQPPLLTPEPTPASTTTNGRTSQQPTKAATKPRIVQVRYSSSAGLSKRAYTYYENPDDPVAVGQAVSVPVGQGPDERMQAAEVVAFGAPDGFENFQHKVKTIPARPVPNQGQEDEEDDNDDVWGPAPTPDPISEPAPDPAPLPEFIGSSVADGPSYLAIPRPDTDREIANLAAEVTNLVTRLNAIIVTDDAKAKLATDDVSMGKKLERAIKAKRDEYVAPARAFIADTDALIKPMMEPLQDANKRVAKALAIYTAGKMAAAEQARQAAMLKEAQELVTQRVDRTTGEILDEAPEPTPPPEKVAPRTKGDVGGVTVRMTTKFEVLDPDMVPREYCKPDEQAIRAAVKGGTKRIPGVRIWDEPESRVYR
jgi:hypothetical protein